MRMTPSRTVRCDSSGPEPSNMRYGYVKQPIGYVPPEVLA
jgi:hypothetical protein